ncbi:MAG TPA: putative toxin-antitoxin system toxin component, PIN family [Casimicrobiaceae bacterium]|jgi:putative PIN family toxin of toxin-antitoxin system|nr:putative toxin-antitoxin system toxin component, PIN family [Casimicrobiaceae bacterium]
MSRAPRVVLDTNVVMSSLVFAHGRLAAVRNAWHQGACSPLVSRVTAAELVRTLAYPKFRLGPAEQRELLADYLPYCTTVRMPAKAPKTPVCRDPADIPFLQLALAGKAEYLVTGDRDLVMLANRFTCAIIRPEAWLQTLEKV